MNAVAPDMSAIPVDLLRGNGEVERDGADLAARWNIYGAWAAGRRAYGLDPYNKTNLGKIGPISSVALPDGRIVDGVNFASQDYLGLSTHPDVQDAARAAIDRYGIHSAGSAALSGNSAQTDELEMRLAAYLGYTDCVVFPTGWGAGYGAIRTLIGEDDHVVIDILAHSCLREGAAGATRNVHVVPHLSVDAVERRLRRLRNSNPRVGILVVTESLFSMDSDSPDLVGLLGVCRQYDARLLVDVAHDMANCGFAGKGVTAQQGLLGDIDFIVGSFSKTLASNGGFVAYNNPSLRYGLRLRCGPLTFTNALSPVQVAVVLKCLDIVNTHEGDALRQSLKKNIDQLRFDLSRTGFQILGKPSAIVPVVVGGNDISRLVTREILARGCIVNLVEYPAVARGACRWRLQVMATHRPEHIDIFVGTAVAARDAARAKLDATGLES